MGTDKAFPQTIDRKMLTEKFFCQHLSVKNLTVAGRVLLVAAEGRLNALKKHERTSQTQNSLRFDEPPFRADVQSGWALHALQVRKQVSHRLVVDLLLEALGHQRPAG